MRVHKLTLHVQYDTTAPRKQANKESDPQVINQNIMLQDQRGSVHRLRMPLPPRPRIAPPPRPAIAPAAASPCALSD